MLPLRKTKNNEKKKIEEEKCQNPLQTKRSVRMLFNTIDASYYSLHEEWTLLAVFVGSNILFHARLPCVFSITIQTAALSSIVQLIGILFVLSQWPLQNTFPQQLKDAAIICAIKLMQQLLIIPKP